VGVGVGVVVGVGVGVGVVQCMHVEYVWFSVFL